MTAVQYYKTLGINLEKIPEVDRNIIGSWYLDDFTWTKEELIEKFGKEIVITNAT